MEKQKSIILRRNYSNTGDNEPLDSAYIDCVLDSIFDPGVVRDFLKETYSKPDNSFCSVDELVFGIRGFFATNITRFLTEATIGQIDAEVIEQAKKLAIFEKTVRIDSTRYNDNNKPNPSAVFWPDPTKQIRPASLYETLPFVEAVDLVRKDTPIGSAGSCFAGEIALYFQRRSFNYVVTESNGKDGSTPDSSAQWGIIFNTPSFTQLAEKAFGLREMPRLADYNDTADVWQDPFREMVSFPTLEALEADRDKHINACREVFLKCKVFCITLGLNECWQYTLDGTVASRNPKSPMHFPLFHHRTLSVAENVDYLQRFLDILRDHNPDIQIIVTVSPIPFLATGRAEETHVVCANEHSKAVLRVAAEEFVAANSGVFYFPSYEMVSRCIKDPWEEDGRHVRRAAVDRIMELFEKMYVRADG